MVDSQLISEWLEKADEDLEFAASIIEDSTFYAQICFHFHQNNSNLGHTRTGTRTLYTPTRSA